jgi:tetratricopeptide (TPR) repeat protein
MHDPASRLNEALEGRYRIESELGEGGMSTVYLAVDLRHERKVALKVLHSELTAVVAGVRFLNEIRTTANLNHPHILPLFDSGEVDGFLYYVMPYVEGESLGARLEREKQLPVDEALEIAAELAAALDYAHRQGVIHRDIKPGNILLHDGQAVLSDFGIALAVDAAGGGRVTSTGNSPGTPYYMSPEQATPGAEVDARTDIYSLACVLYEMLAGEPVFKGLYVVAQHLNVDPPVEKLTSRVPQGVEDAITRALRKDPADRFETMRDFAVALERGVPSTISTRDVWRAVRKSVRTRPFAVTAAGLALLGTAAVSAPLLFSGPAWTVRPESVVVLPFHESTSSDEERALAAQVADAITRELQSWDGVTVATNVDLAGPRRDLGLSEPTLERTADGLAMAYAVDAQAMVVLTARQQGDSVSLQASVFDSRSRRRVGEPIMVSGLSSEIREVEVLAPVVAGVLGFGDAPQPSRALRAGTSNPEAAVAYLHGRDALERNRLDEAEAHLSRALQLDGTFATALSFLSQSHFWRGVEAQYFISRGPEISRWSTAAMGHLGGLSAQNEAHVRGFFDLQLGDFEEARERYGAILQSDPTDAYAQLMLGEIELLDRWSVRDGEGRPVPRSNLNRARRAFSAAVRMEPTFELAYGQMFAIQRLLENPLRRAGCGGFYQLRGELVPVWQRLPTPDAQTRAFCPVALDSIVWIASSEFASSDDLPFRTGANRLFRQTVGELERWANFAPEQPRPLELLADAHLLQRQDLAVGAPERHAASAAEALRFLSRALAMEPDTTPFDVARLANLHLAAGNPGAAIAFARSALARYAASATGSADTIPAPQALINVLVVSGQTSAALAITSSVSGRRLVPDPETGEMISLTETVPNLERLRILGSSGVSGPLVRNELRRLQDAWAGLGHSPRQRQILRESITSGIALNLAFDSVALSDWSRSVEIEEAWWLALSQSDTDPARAQEHLMRARDSLARESSSAPLSFLLAVTAGKLGLHAEAIRLHSRLDSIPPSTTGFDSGWGLQVLSHFLRAEHYEHLGDLPAATEHYRSFIDARSWPDSLSSPMLETARERVARISNTM